MDEYEQERDRIQKERAYDEAVTKTMERLPTAVRRFYERLVEEGFDETKAMKLTEVYLFATTAPLGVIYVGG